MSDQDYETFEVIIQMTYRLPADKELRRSIYGGFSDPACCFDIDLEADPAACLLDICEGIELIAIRPIPNNQKDQSNHDQHDH